ncbi:uncharacterized protein PAC_13499 [Phialocephala subalpina]|uniref:Uncharacterized protein n=1 Tax=Phialocephala subalpina TaxID=576137 RepID=A0A1L7XEZ1_9HELO|nr:uncharacterized protein PAC_13499 [Phialocephala subalpina]
MGEAEFQTMLSELKRIAGGRSPSPELPIIKDPAYYTKPPSSQKYLPQPLKLPVPDHLVPNRKDLPPYLNSRYRRACADFGAASNVIDEAYALGLGIDIKHVRCPKFQLPTFQKRVRPIGVAMITCEFLGGKNSGVGYPFFVFKRFVYQAIVGRGFLRATRTIDLYQTRLHDKPLLTQDLPVVASFGDTEESLRFWLDGEEMFSTPDTGAEVNVMSTEFAIRRGFEIQPDSVHQVRFADGSIQDVRGRVSKPVSFEEGAPPSLLLRLTDVRTALNSDPSLQNRDPTGKLSYQATASILANLYILNGLLCDIIFDQDVLTTVNAFVQHSVDFKQQPANFYPAIAQIHLLKKFEREILGLFGRASPKPNRPLTQRQKYTQQLEDADHKELARYEGEQRRINREVVEPFKR